MRHILTFIDNFLNRITMYKLLLFGLYALVIIATLLSFLGVLHFSGLSILLSLLILLVTCFVVNFCLSILWNSDSNSESWGITALILCLILPPTTSLHTGALVALAGGLAMASKYIIAVRHKHLFNPAAIAVVILGFGGVLPAIWWIGSPPLSIFTIVLGILILRKLHRFELFFSFGLTSLAVSLIIGLVHTQSIPYIISTLLLSSPFIFLGTVMLTEPETMPPTRKQQRIYGSIVGLIFTSQLSFVIISATPEIALIIGNIFAYLVATNYKIKLQFLTKTEIAPQIFELQFSGPRAISFRAGQYFEWTLKHPKADIRGNRRTFTIASAPGEERVSIIIKTATPLSSFKKSLLDMKKNTQITVGQLGGSFVLPKNTNSKIALIAGGVGITPFLSMAKDLINRHEHRDIVLLYLVSKETDYTFIDTWQKARQYGLKVIPILTNNKYSPTWDGITGPIDTNLLKKHLPDYSERLYYISGPNGLVQFYKHLFGELNIKYSRIKTDYFSGY